VDGERGWSGYRRVVWALSALACAALAGCASSAATPHHPTSTGWVKDSVHALNIYLPDADSIYWNDGYGTAKGARTVISGQTPVARYWSFTAYAVPEQSNPAHVHDTEIAQSNGRYTVTIAASCAGVPGTCLPTGSSAPAGIVVMRLYVPIDIDTTGTGGVGLPTITYLGPSGHPLTLGEASGSTTVATLLDGLRTRNGALPASLTRHYPSAPPVPIPIQKPPPKEGITHGTGPFANPDAFYQHVTFRTTRGNLVVSAQAPTYQSDSNPAANDLGRAAAASPQVRYWSLCVVLKGRHTGDCLRDEQVHIPADASTFTVIVSPTCPVAGYANCIDSGPEPLQSSLSYRNLLPSPSFSSMVFAGPYGLKVRYVARPG
jgi:hypothetical protein